MDHPEIKTRKELKGKKGREEKTGSLYSNKHIRAYENIINNSNNNSNNSKQHTARSDKPGR
jgi:hypothetical protein